MKLEDKSECPMESWEKVDNAQLEALERDVKALYDEGAVRSEEDTRLLLECDRDLTMLARERVLEQELKAALDRACETKLYPFDSTRVLPLNAALRVFELASGEMMREIGAEPFRHFLRDVRRFIRSDTFKLGFFARCVIPPIDYTEYEEKVLERRREDELWSTLHADLDDDFDADEDERDGAANGPESASATPNIITQLAPNVHVPKVEGRQKVVIHGWIEPKSESELNLTIERIVDQKPN